MAAGTHTPPPRAGAARPDPGNPGRRSGASPAGDDPAAASGGAGREAVDEEAHWRLDDHQRRMEGMERAISPDVIAAVVHGAVAALHASMQAETERLLKSIKEDIDTDKAVVQAIGELVAELKAQRLATAAV